MSDDFPECPIDLLPPGVPYASWDPEVLRLAAQTHNQSPIAGPMAVKAWVVLVLLRDRDELALIKTQVDELQALLIAAVAQKEFLEAAIKTYVPHIWADIERSLRDA